MPIWWETDDGVVGADGLAHTASPPYPGIDESDLLLVVSGNANDLGELELAADIDQIGQATGQTQQAIQAEIQNVLTSVEAVDLYTTDVFGVTLGSIIDANTGLISMTTPTNGGDPVPVVVERIPKFGLPDVTVNNVQINANQVTKFSITLDPTQVAAQAPGPQIVEAQINFEPSTTSNGLQPDVVVTATGTGDNPNNLSVTFTAANGLTVTEGVLQGLTLTAPGPNDAVAPGAMDIHVPAPTTLAVGTAEISVTRTDTANVSPPYGQGNAPTMGQPAPITGNAVKLNPSGQYVFVALPELQYDYTGNQVTGIDGALAVIDGDSTHDGTNDTPDSFNKEIAQIPLGDPSDFPLPRDVAVTPDNTRAYVTLRGSGQVAVVDTLSLQEINVNGNSPPPAQDETTPVPVSGNGGGLDPALRLKTITGPFDIRGIVTDGDWTLDLGAWTPTWSLVQHLASGTGTADTVVLDSFDPTAYADLKNGFYRLRLSRRTRRMATAPSSTRWASASTPTRAARRSTCPSAPSLTASPSTLPGSTPTSPTRGRSSPAASTPRLARASTPATWRPTSTSSTSTQPRRRTTRSSTPSRSCGR